tara:strand:- start:2344 stop:2667 length:324 start_codon:yes stop_codon:yes gene_type:complete
VANVTGLVAGQEYSRIDDFFRFADTPHGDMGLPEVEALVRIRGDGQAGDGVHEGDVDDDTAAAFQHLQNHAPSTQADPAQIRIDDPDPIVGFGLLKCLGKIDAGVVE